MTPRDSVLARAVRILEKLFPERKPLGRGEFPDRSKP